MSAQSWRNRSFTIADPDARLRVAGNLGEFVMAAGQPRTITNGTAVQVIDVAMQPSGARGMNIFLEVTGTDGVALGWTSATNVAGKFYSETVGEVPRPAQTNQFGSHAAWQGGQFLGQIDLIRIVGTGYEIETLSARMVAPFLAMVAAARAAGCELRLNSGFRTFAEQKNLHDGFTRGLPGFNLAARPGRSNHQSGIAVDLDVKPGEGNPNYAWLKREATSFGFVRTVASEAWHWEFRPDAARVARAAGRFLI